MTRSLKTTITALALSSLTHASDTFLPLLPVGGHDGDAFGIAVALSDDVAVVGADQDGTNGPDAGAAYVFNVEQRRQLWKIVPSDGALKDRFGYAADVDGDRIAIGAILHGLAGAVYLYDLPSRSLIHKFVPDDLVDQDSFGMALVLRGNRLYIGAPSDDDAGEAAGAVYVFDAVSGTRLHKWTASDAEPQDHFGVSLALDGDRLLVGTIDDDAGFSSGSAYLLEPSTGTEIAKLLPGSVKSGDYFGLGVALIGRRAFVGAPRDFPEDLGQVFAFDAGSGALVGKFTSSAAHAGLEFGRALAGSERFLVVGGPGAEGGDSVLTLVDPVTLVEIKRFIAPSPLYDDFGAAVDLRGDRLLVGSRQTHPGLPGAVWVGYLDGLPPVGAPLCEPAATNSTGLPGLLVATGAVEVSVNTVTLTASQIPSGEFAMLLNGRDQGLFSPPGSQGTLCIAGPTGRYLDQLKMAGAGGAAVFALDLEHTPTFGGEIAIQAGETWTFQCWYRDVNPGATTNFTNAVEITFE